MEVDISQSNYQSVASSMALPRQQPPDSEMREEGDLGNQGGLQNDYHETQTDPRGFFADTKTAAACSVRVALRVRPLVGRELYESPNICVTCYTEQDQLVIGKDRNFTFDKVFDIKTRQQDVFDSCVKNLVLGCFSGYNATVLAYGQTGSGKTFTMGSSYTIGMKDEELGIIPRVIRLIFDEVDKRKSKAEFIIKCTFLEIYNEELNDLLDHGNLTSARDAAVMDRFLQKKDISIREEKNGNISVYGLREEKVSCYEELAACLDKGSNFRSTASTLMNNCSSRSHAIFTITIEQHVIDDLYQPNYGGATQNPQPAADSEEFMVAKFHFVDLAGSERAKKTGATGATLKEGISINKGLLALGNVISALTEDTKKNNHIPYRDSKLTRILQDSLGGNSRTSMIACVSPAEINFEETLNTLKYASRARNIKNKPIVNRDPNSAQVAQLRQQLYEMQRELQGARKLLISNNIEFEQSNSMPIDLSMMDGKGFEGQGFHKEYVNHAEIQRYDQEVKDLKQMISSKDKKNNALQTQCDGLQDQLSSTQIEFFQVQKERDVTRFQLEQMISLLKKREIYKEIMDELHGFNKGDGIMVDETNSKIDNPDYDFLFGSSGPCILEEYQVKVEEQKRELANKQTQIKQLQKDYEMLLQSSQQDTTNLESKEKEIERLKRSVNKLQKENVQVRNDQRRGTTTARQNVPTQSIQPQTTMTARKQSTINTERKLVPQYTFSNVKKPMEPIAENKEWISNELDYNIKHFNDLFIENLSQSLSTMLVVKKGQQPAIANKDEEMKTPTAIKVEDINPLNEVQEFMAGRLNDQEDEIDSDNESEEEQAQEIEQIIPQGEVEIQEVIDQNEETKQQDMVMKSILHSQEQQIVGLDGDLKDKEALLQHIKNSHKLMSNNLLEAMKNEYHKKIDQLQQDMVHLEREKIESLKKAESAVQKSKLEEAYKKKLKDLEEQLNQIKLKDREQSQMLKDAKVQKDKIQKLEQEIERIKTQKVTMMKKMKEEGDKHRKWKAERVKELMQVKQSNQKKDREIQKLKRENVRKDQLAKRKQEELSVLMKKTRIDKQKQVNASKDRMQKTSIDIQAIQQWIISNTEKMLRYKELQQLMEQELVMKKHSEDQIADEQQTLAQFQVRREKLEFRKCQLQQNSDSDNDEAIYQIDEEINQITYEMKAIQESIENIEEKFDFIEAKVSQINTELLGFSPDDIQQLRFEQVQSIEGARACLGAFFGILLDINVYKKQLEKQNAQNEATIESLGQQIEEFMKIQQANEISFQKELEQIMKEYQDKEELMIRIIMENGGQEIEKMMGNLNQNQESAGLPSNLLTRGSSLNAKEPDQTSAITQATSANLQRRGTVTTSLAKLEVQKSKEQSYNQSKTTLSKRVAELERKLKDEQKKTENFKHKFEQSNQEKEVIKKQKEQLNQKLKTQEVQEVKQFKNAPPSDEVAQQYNSNQVQKSPRHQQKAPMITLNDKRNQRKINKLGSTKGTLISMNQPGVIADEVMEDEEETPFIKEQKGHKPQNSIDQTQVLQAVKSNSTNMHLQSCDLEQTNVFARLSQVVNKPKIGGVNNGSLNTSQNLTGSMIEAQQQQVKSTSFEEDKRWKNCFTKDEAHPQSIYALASFYNQLYTSSHKKLRVWNVENMQMVSDITQPGLIKCMTIWKEKNILLAASEKTIQIWDFGTLTQVGILTAHKNEIKAMKVSPDGTYMFSAGNGTQDAPGLLIWDLRKASSPIDEREQNQDIFSLAVTQDKLFYGCRSHEIIHFNYRNGGSEPQSFTPPHFGAVSSLALLDNTLISASRDKYIRTWDINQPQVQNYLSMEEAHNDWINCLETSAETRELYSGSKDGAVKVWAMKNDRLTCMAKLQGSSTDQPINAITNIDKQFGNIFATGSSDRCLRMWKKNSKSTQQQTSQDQEMQEAFERVNLDKNQDYDDQEARLMSRHEEVKEHYMSNESKLFQIGKSNTAGSTNQYMPQNQITKLEQKRRQKRVEENQKRYQKENDQNYKQL